MANPQKENGYTVISNELLEAFYQCKLQEYERVIILCIWRKTYGWNKKRDLVAYSQIEKETGMVKQSIAKIIKNLVNKKLLIKDKKSLGVNKNYEDWVVEWRVKKSAVQLTKVSPPAYQSKPTSLPQKKLLQKKLLQKKKPSVESDNYKPIHSPLVAVFDTINTSMKTKITKEENVELIKVGLLWQEMASKTLGISKEDVVMKNIYYPIRNLYDKHGYKFEDFKKLFTYFFSDSRIKYEDKIAFDLCMSEKYHAKYKLSNKKHNIPSVERFKL